MDFVLIGTEAINPAFVHRAEWKVAGDGRDGVILIHVGGEIRSVAFGHPAAKAAAEAFGFRDLYAAWPKVKAAADAKWAEADAAKKANKGRLARV